MCNGDGLSLVSMKEYLENYMEDREIITLVVDGIERDIHCNLITLGDEELFIRSGGVISYEAIEEIL